MNKNELLAATVGVLIGGVLINLFLSSSGRPQNWTEHDTHTEDEVHTHTDIVIVINDELVDITLPEYQSTKESLKDKHVHLHDGTGEVIHRHAEGVTFGAFLDSIGFILTDECLTVPSGEAYCVDDLNELVLYVNKKPFPTPTTYGLYDEDQILLYYGLSNNPKVAEYLSSVTDKACMYSGTCPERGTPPPEECGLTCEISGTSF